MSYNAVLPRGATPTYSATPGAHPLIKEDLADEIIKGVTEKSIVLTQAKKRRMSTQQARMAVLDSKPTAYFITGGDTGLKQTTTMLWANKFLDAQEVAVIVPIPLNLLDDVDIDLWSEFRPEIEEAFAVVIDGAILFDINKPSVWPTAIAPAAIAAGNTVTQGAGVDIAADVNNVIGAVEADGFSPNGIFFREPLRATFRGLRSSTNELIFNMNTPGVEDSNFKGRIWGLKAMSSHLGTFEAHNAAAANATNLISGDWNQLIIGMRQDMRVSKHTDGVIQDLSGAITFNLLQQDMIAARFTMRLAFQVPNPINRLQATAGNRYPFAVLRDAA